MKKEILEKIIANHQHYLARDVEGWEKMRADLSNTNLINANLKWTDLREADLHFAILSNANLENACLADANLRGTYMVNAILSNANLEEANLYGADLTFAELDGANLTGANLCRTQLIETEKFRKGVVLSESIIGWKKCLSDVIVELEIPKGAVVFCINGNKYRTNKCKVISISNGNKGISLFDYKFIYEVGKEIEIENFDLQYNVECGRGIHFFKSKEDAEKY